MPDLYALIAAFVDESLVKLKAASADGLTFKEAFGLFLDAIERLVKLASEFSLPGADKKAMVMGAIDKLFDQVIAPIDIPYIPEVVERTVVDPALKKLLLAAADQMVEFFVSKLPKPTDATV